MSQPQNPPSLLDSTLTNDGFWPDVPIRAWVEGYRIQSDARDQMILAVLLLAILDTNDAVRPAKVQAQADGYATLAEYTAAHPDEGLNGQPVAAILYFSAVHNLAKAKLIKRLQVLGRRPIPETETLGSDNTEGYFLDEHQNAVGRLLSRMALGQSGQTNFGVYVASLGDGWKP